MNAAREAVATRASSPREVGDALARVREAGRWLREQRTEDVIDRLACALDRLRDARDPARRALEEALPEATGFDPETVRDGLARALAPLSGDALRALARRELGAGWGDDAVAGPLAGGFECAAVILGGSLPTPTLIDLIASLAARSPVVARTSRHDRVTAPRVAALLHEIDPRLGACVETLDFAHDDDACLDALLDADCVVATGSDQAIDALRARIRAPRRFIARGHRASIACLDTGALTPAGVGTIARALAIDVATFDQLGCLSAISVHLIGPDPSAAPRLAESLADELGALSVRMPRGRVDAGAAALLAQERAGAELRAAGGRDVRVHGAPQHGFTVVCEDDPTLRPAPLHRFVRVHPAAEFAHAARALQPLAGRLAGVAIAGFEGPSRAAMVRLASQLGASRLCAPGTLQSPPLGWHHEGCGVLLPFVRLMDDEGTAG